VTKKKDPAISKSEALVLAWKSREDYRGYEKGKGSAFNSWRSILYTEKGNHIGFPESWRDFRVFLAEVKGDWSIGKNVVPCCYSCNCARNDNFSYEEMLEIGKTIRKIKDRRNAKSK